MPKKKTQHLDLEKRTSQINLILTKYIKTNIIRKRSSINQMPRSLNYLKNN